MGTDSRYSTQRSTATERISAVIESGIRSALDRPKPTASADRPKTHVVIVVQRSADATMTWSSRAKDFEIRVESPKSVMVKSTMQNPMIADVIPISAGETARASTMTLMACSTFARIRADRIEANWAFMRRAQPA